MKNHQDWENITFKKKNPTSSKDAKAREFGVNKERISNKNKAYKNETDMRKVENEEIKINKIDIKMSKLIQRARFDSKISQKDLANKLNLQVSVIQNYENGKAVPNKNLLFKMGKILKMHLTGKSIGTKMV
jgi:putative transcription factor